jgi:hypothetical protein
MSFAEAEQDERSDAAHGESPMHYCIYDNILDRAEPMPGLATRNLIGEQNLMSMSRCPSLRLSKMRHGGPRCRRKSIPSSRIVHGSWLTCCKVIAQSP